MALLIIGLMSGELWSGDVRVTGMETEEHQCCGLILGIGLMFVHNGLINNNIKRTRRDVGRQIFHCIWSVGLLVIVYCLWRRGGGGAAAAAAATGDVTKLPSK